MLERVFLILQTDMLRTFRPAVCFAFVAFLSMLALPVFPADEFTAEHKDLFREFVRLMNYGEEEEFYAQAARYEQYLKDNQMIVEYYKIKTNEGFFDVNHMHPLRAMQTAQQLDNELHDAGDTAHYYLATGLKADIYKLMRSPKADSIYRQALVEVGQADPKFTMLAHMGLAQVNYLTHPEQSIEWANLALREAEELNNMEHRSMSLGLQCYLFFMMDNREQFEETVQKYNRLQAEFDSLTEQGQTLGRQRFSHRYDMVIEVAKTAFQGEFEKAIEMANNNQLNVDRQLVVYRIYGLEGQYKKEESSRKLVWGFVVMTALYIIVYIMGRRRLWVKIQQRKAELGVAMEKAETANRMKASFIRSMSHEIRTPLNAVNGFSQILCSSDFALSEQERQQLKQSISSNTEAITIIINELLELAAGESVTMDKDSLLPVNVNMVCRKATTNAKKHNDKKLNITFTTTLTDDFTVRSNSEMLSQILNKVIDNAKKFTAEGDVHVTAGLNGKQVEISVADTGIGIPEEKCDDIFENFVKLDDYKEGVGLGLPICRRLARALGGDIVLDTDYKQGSRFVLQLPL